VRLSIDALIETAYQRVIPLYSFDGRNRPHVLASGVPFAQADDAFLITAAHSCFEDGKPLPLFVYGKERPHALNLLRGAWEYRAGETPDLDLAVIGLRPDCVADLAKGHLFARPGDVGTVLPKTPGVHYLIAGYPGSRNRKRPVEYGLPGRATALVTGDVCTVVGVDSPDKSDDTHFALDFPHTTIPRAGGGEFRVPPPSGMSGGGVWRVEVDVRTRLASRPLLVGIGIEFYPARRKFVATRIQQAAPLAADLVAELQKLGPNIPPCPSL